MSMKVANRCKDVVKTEKQWNQLGFKLLSEKNGERMWTNQFCQIISTYYTEKEVEKMTEDEFDAWKENDRKKKNQRAKELRKIRIEKEKQLEEEWRQAEQAREQNGRNG